MAIWSFLSTFCEHENYWMSLETPQTPLKIPGFMPCFREIKSIDCEPIKSGILRRFCGVHRLIQYFSYSQIVFRKVRIAI
jgi:hypothetical protein